MTFYVSACSGRRPKVRRAVLLPNENAMAVAWFDMPTHQPFPFPPIVVGGESVADALNRAIVTARGSFGRGDGHHVLRAEWARAHRYRMRGHGAWPEDRERDAAKARADSALYNALVDAAMRERRLRHLTDEQLQMMSQRIRREDPESIHIVAETLARMREQNEHFYGGLPTTPIVSLNVDALRALGLGAKATADDVKRAFKRRALTTHPDGGGSPEAFRELVRQRDAALRAIGAST